MDDGKSDGAGLVVLPFDELKRAVRNAYENGLGTQRMIQRQYNVTKGQIDGWKQREGWARRYAVRGFSRELIVDRMLRILGAQLMYMENEMTNGRPIDVGMLEVLTRTLGKLNELDLTMARRSKSRSGSPGIEELRSKIVGRIDQLNQN